MHGLCVDQVTDFGLSRFKATSVSEKMTGQAGTYHWMAPEVREMKGLGDPCCIPRGGLGKDFQDGGDVYSGDS